MGDAARPALHARVTDHVDLPGLQFVNVELTADASVVSRDVHAVHTTPATCLARELDALVFEGPGTAWFPIHLLP